MIRKKLKTGIQLTPVYNGCKEKFIYKSYKISKKTTKCTINYKSNSFIGQKN